MNQIKIISNPYQKTIEFFRLEETDGIKTWINFAEQSKKLLPYSEKSDFFPFKAKDIVDKIVEELEKDNEKIHIILEATEGEYQELQNVCECYYSDRIELAPLQTKLRNPDDMLEEITKIFKEFKPLIYKAFSDDKILLDRVDDFIETTSETIPLCIIGNYSSGKSTFINALIGYEILPSTSQPTTARIYEISQSENVEKAIIKFQYEDSPVKIEYKFGVNTLNHSLDNNPLFDKIEDCLENDKNEALHVQLNKMLNIINSYANSENKSSISDLIELSVPFCKKGIWSRTNKKCIIIDTPGSNAANHKEHLETLESALQNLSNGLPIFVLESTSLSTDDNNELYEKIKQIDNLDKRFALIIVNKADLPGHGECDEKTILDQTFPSKAYAAGIYFVSSILGLGYKNDGNFIDDELEEFFDEKSIKYSDSNNKYYKQLYKSDILPKQLKDNYEDFINNNNCDNIYVNSGLCFVEKAIEDFVEKYANYNKCQQAIFFIGQLIERLEEESKKSCDRISSNRDISKRLLDKGREDIVEEFSKYYDEKNNFYIEDYGSITNKATSEDYYKLNPANISEKKKLLNEQESLKNEVEEKKKNKDNAIKEIGIDIRENWGKIFNGKFNFKKVGGLFADFGSDIKGMCVALNDYIKAQNDTNAEVNKNLIDTVSSQFTSLLSEIQSGFDKYSRAILTEKSKELKEKLENKISNNNQLSQRNRDKLSGIILEYEPLTFDDNIGQNIFDFSKFKKPLSNNIDETKLVKTYNAAIEDEIEKIISNIQLKHLESLQVWSNTLKTRIMDNVTELNPELYNMQAQIDIDTKNIEIWKEDIEQLSCCRKSISDLLTWIK